MKSMPSQIIENALQSNLNLTEWKVLMAWSMDADSYSACPRILSERTGVAIKHVRSALTRLMKKGLLVKSDSKIVNTQKGRQTMTVYSVGKGVSVETPPSVKKGALLEGKGSPSRGTKGALLEGPISNNKPNNKPTNQNIDSQASQVRLGREEKLDISGSNRYDSLTPEEGEYNCLTPEEIFAAMEDSILNFIK